MSITPQVPDRGPIESKVWASLIGAGSGTVLSTFLLWLIGAAFWTHDWSNEGADDAILSVPSPLSAFVLAAITAGLTFLGGYLAKHTPRVDRDALETMTTAQRVETTEVMAGELGLPEDLRSRPIT